MDQRLGLQCHPNCRLDLWGICSTAYVKNCQIHFSSSVQHLSWAVTGQAARFWLLSQSVCTLNPKGAEDLKNQTTIRESLRLQYCSVTALSKAFIADNWYVEFMLCPFICRCSQNDKQQIQLQLTLSLLFEISMFRNVSTALVYNVQQRAVQANLDCWLTVKSSPWPDRCFCILAHLQRESPSFYLFLYHIPPFSLCFKSAVSLH